MNTPNLSQGQINLLLNLASKKLGLSSTQLRAKLEQGDLPQGLNANTVAQYLNDPKKLEQLLNSEQVKQALNGLMGGR